MEFKIIFLASLILNLALLVTTMLHERADGTLEVIFDDDGEIYPVLMVHNAAKIHENNGRLLLTVRHKSRN